MADEESLVETAQSESEDQPPMEIPVDVNEDSSVAEPAPEEGAASEEPAAAESAVEEAPPAADVEQEAELVKIEQQVELTNTAPDADAVPATEESTTAVTADDRTEDQVTEIEEDKPGKMSELGRPSLEDIRDLPEEESSVVADAAPEEPAAQMIELAVESEPAPPAEPEPEPEPEPAKEPEPEPPAAEPEPEPEPPAAEPEPEPAPEPEPEVVKEPTPPPPKEPTPPPKEPTPPPPKEPTPPPAKEPTPPPAKEPTPPPPKEPTPPPAKEPTPPPPAKEPSPPAKTKKTPSWKSSSKSSVDEPTTPKKPLSRTSSKAKKEPTPPPPAEEPAPAPEPEPEAPAAEPEPVAEEVKAEEPAAAVEEPAPVEEDTYKEVKVEEEEAPAPVEEPKAEVQEPKEEAPERQTSPPQAASTRQRSPPRESPPRSRPARSDYATYETPASVTSQSYSTAAVPRTPSHTTYSSYAPKDSYKSSLPYIPYSSRISPAGKYQNEYTSGYSYHRSTPSYVSQFDNYVKVGSFSQNLWSTERSRSRTRERYGASRERASSSYSRYGPTQLSSVRRRDYSAPPVPSRPSSAYSSAAPSRSTSYSNMMGYIESKNNEIRRDRSRSRVDDLSRSSSRSSMVPNLAESINTWYDKQLASADTYVKRSNEPLEAKLSQYSSYRYTGRPYGSSYGTYTPSTQYEYTSSYPSKTTSTRKYERLMADFDNSNYASTYSSSTRTSRPSYERTLFSTTSRRSDTLESRLSGHPTYSRQYAITSGPLMTRSGYW